VLGPHRACPGGEGASALQGESSGVLGPHRACPGGRRLLHYRGVVRCAWCPHRACPGGSRLGGSAQAGNHRGKPGGGSARHPPQVVQKPPSTGASPVGANRWGDRPVVQKSSCHRDKPGGKRATSASDPVQPDGPARHNPEGHPRQVALQPGMRSGRGLPHPGPPGCCALALPVLCSRKASPHEALGSHRRSGGDGGPPDLVADPRPAHGPCSISPTARAGQWRCNARPVALFLSRLDGRLIAFRSGTVQASPRRYALRSVRPGRRAASYLAGSPEGMPPGPPRRFPKQRLPPASSANWSPS
jgi:hypothetical protein